MTFDGIIILIFESKGVCFSDGNTTGGNTIFQNIDFCNFSFSILSVFFICHMDFSSIYCVIIDNTRLPIVFFKYIVIENMLFFFLEILWRGKCDISKRSGLIIFGQCDNRIRQCRSSIPGFHMHFKFQAIRPDTRSKRFLGKESDIITDQFSTVIPIFMTLCICFYFLANQGAVIVTTLLFNLCIRSNNVSHPVHRR